MAHKKFKKAILITHEMTHSLAAHDCGIARGGIAA